MELIPIEEYRKGGRQPQIQPNTGLSLTPIEEYRRSQATPLRTFSAAEVMRSFETPEPEMNRQALIRGATFLGAPPSQRITVEDVRTGRAQVPESIRRQVEEYRPYQGTPRSLADRIIGGASDATIQAINAAYLGLPNALLPGGRQAQQETQSTAGTVGRFIGEAVPIAGAYRLTRGLTTPLTRNAPRVVQTAARGAAAGATYSGAKELADIVLDTRGDEDQTLAERAGNVALETALFAGGDAVVSAAAPWVRRGLERLLNRKQTQSQQDVLALPAPRQRGNVNTVQTPEVINVPETGPRALPEPSFQPTRARTGPNPYRVKFERLIEEANKRQFTPGRELEELEDLWSRMAEPTDPSLDRLIDLAYPSRRISPNALQRGRMAQIAGLGPNVRRMPEPQVTGTVAMPETRVGVRRAETTRETPTVAQPARETPLAVTAQTVESAQPTRQNWFTRLFGNFGVGISPFGSTRRVRKGLLDTSEQIVGSPLRKDIQGLKQNAQATARAVYQNFVDYLSPLKRISREIYDKAIDAARANNIANVIVRDKFVNPQGQVVGEGLQNIFRKVGRGESKAFTDYLVLRHALTRMQRGERVYDPSLNMTPEKVQQRIQMYEQRYPNFVNIAREWDQYNDNLLRVYGVEEGLISPELYRLLRERNPNYAPMRRQFSTSEKFASPLNIRTKSTFSGQKAPIKEVSPTGSIRRIVDPRRSTIEATGAWVNAALRNRVMQGIVNHILRDPEGMKDIAEIVQPKKGQPNLRQILLEEGPEDFLEMLDEDFNKLFKRTRLDDDNIVRAMVRGEPVYIRVKDPEAVKALVGMGAEQSNLILDMAGFLSDLTKRGATGALAPMFAIKGIGMDTVQALIQSKAPVQHLWDLVYATFSTIADRLPANTPGTQRLRQLAQDFRRVGGEYSAALRGDRRLRRGISEMNRYPILSPQNIARTAGRALTLPFRAMEGLADISENLNRMAAFRGAMRRQGGDRSPEAIRQALMEAREITANWSRRGSQANMIEKFIPYQNAAIQGLYRFAKAFKDNPIKTTAMVGGAVMVPKFLEYMMFHDDPDYQKLPARERYRNLFIAKNEDGTFVKIPMSPEYNAFGAFMQDILAFYKDEDPDAFKGVADAVANAFLPPLLSGAAQGITQSGGVEQSLAGLANASVLAPYAAIMTNQSFTGAPIVPQRLQNMSPRYQYDERTSAIAIQIGNILNMSPMKVDYLLRAYGGDPARLLLPLTSEVGAGRPRETILRNFIADPVFTNTLADDFYTAKENLTRAYNDNKNAGVPLPEWFDPALYKLVTSQAKGAPSKVLSDLGKLQRQISADKSLSATERAELQRDIRARMNEIYLDINTLMEQAGVPMSGR